MVSEHLVGLLCPAQDSRLWDRFPLDYWMLRYHELLVQKAPKHVLEAIKQVIRRLINTA